MIAHTQKEINRPISFINIDFKNYVYYHSKKTIHYDNVKFISGIKVLFLIGNPFI